jgi:hypothetical protein
MFERRIVTKHIPLGESDGGENDEKADGAQRINHK